LIRHFAQTAYQLLTPVKETQSSADLEKSSENSSDSSDVEQQQQNRAAALAFQATHLAQPTDCSGDESARPLSRPVVACDGHPFPPRSLTSYDQQSVSCGLFSQYDKWMKEACDAYEVSDSLPQEPAKLGRKPHMKAFLTHVIEQFKASSDYHVSA
jgi:hypothetical protein